MVESASPGMYWRYSANSTLKPLKGLRWRPERNPSTIVRALSSSVPRRATTAGSRNGRSCAVQGDIRGCPPSHSTPRDGNRFEQPFDDRVGVDAFRFRVKVRHDAVAQNRLGERLDVLDRDVIAAVHQRPGLRAAHQRLRTAQPGSPFHPLVDVIRGTGDAGP